MNIATRIAKAQLTRDQILIVCFCEQTAKKLEELEELEETEFQFNDGSELVLDIVEDNIEFYMVYNPERDIYVTYKNGEVL